MSEQEILEKVRLILEILDGLYIGEAEVILDVAKKKTRETTISCSTIKLSHV